MADDNPNEELEVVRDEDGETFTVTRAQWNRTYRADGGYSLKGDKAAKKSSSRSKKSDDAPEASED